MDNLQNTNNLIALVKAERKLLKMHKIMCQNLVKIG